ncbi:S8 family serine peptidase [Membranicola marinus]|uniref:S8 family serine peptidase n=1 Tax=Membranihabitans marinus TaxID=1227546 RepID=A0A953L9Z5_9BACT|nr:S8 family serine peptidase [Membranihabitans marinus]MBY5957131.1 S8 family serine peptidase [Membranihabitans marinus]
MEVLHELNGITYILAVGFMGLWFLFSSRQTWNVIMGVGFFICLFANFAITMGASLGPVKYFVFSKNLLLIAFFSFIFRWLRSNKIGLVLAIVASIALSMLLFKMKIENRVVPSNLQHPIELGELLIKTSPDHIDMIRVELSAYSARIEKAFYPEMEGTALDKFYVIDIPDDQSDKKRELLAVLHRHQLITYGEYNDVVQIQPRPGLVVDEIPTSIFVNDPLSSGQWAFEKLNFNRWYKLLMDHRDQVKQTVQVAVLDTGIDGSHEDLNRMVDPVYQDMKDPVGHGTHCAGIIAAETNNQKGISSMAFYNDIIRIMPVKVLNRMGFGTQVQIIRGMIRAVDQGAGVLSMSLGGISDEPKQKAYLTAVQYANDHNVVVVTSAGNSSRSAQDFSPANVPGVICVTALDDKNRLAYFSNYLVDIEWGIAAPGADILSTFPGDQYKSMSGTSMAAPFVSSVVGVIKAFAPALTSSEIYKLLHETSQPTLDVAKSGGLVQPAAALKAVLTSF